MKYETFYDLMIERFIRCMVVFEKKHYEYNGAEVGVFHNFELQAKIASTSPGETILGNMSKHWASIHDLLESAEKGTTINPEVISEKFTDAIIYLTILEAWIKELEISGIR